MSITTCGRTVQFRTLQKALLVDPVKALRRCACLSLTNRHSRPALSGPISTAGQAKIRAAFLISQKGTCKDSGAIATRTLLQKLQTCGLRGSTAVNKLLFPVPQPADRHRERASEATPSRSSFTTMASVGTGSQDVLPEALGWKTLHRRAPASIRTLEADIDTPALIVDLDAMDRNLEELNALLKAYPSVRPRLHAKAHKSPGIALLQLERHDAVGVCCQKLTEAEAMVMGGVPDVLLSNEVVSKPKLARLALLAQHAKVSVCADSLENVHNISRTAQEVSVTIGVLIEVNVGQNRCGVDTPEEAVALARVIANLPGLTFKGIQAYHGGIQHLRIWDERRLAVEKVVTKAKAVVEALREAGLECSVVTGGGTGTFEFEAASGVYTEVRHSSYLT
jgi:hypothetical protein